MNKEPDAFEGNERIPLAEELEMDERDTDTLYREEIQSLQSESEIQRLSHRMSLMFILVPTLLFAVFAFAYIDLRGKLKEMQSTGEKEVQALSADVVGRVTALLEQYQSLEDSIKSRLSAAEKGLEKATAGLDRERKEINALNASKVDQKYVEAATKEAAEAMAEKIAGLKREITVHKTALQTLAEKLEKELDEEANAVATFQSDLRMQGERVTKVSQTLEGVQKKALDLDLGIRGLREWQEKRNQDLEREKRERMALEEKLEGLGEEIAWVEDQLKLKREKGKTPEQKQEQSPSQEVPLPSTATGEGSEKIIEQNISE